MLLLRQKVVDTRDGEWQYDIRVPLEIVPKN